MNLLTMTGTQHDSAVARRDGRLRMFAAFGRVRAAALPDAKYMNEYRVFHKDDPACYCMVKGSTSGKARTRCWNEHHYHFPEGSRYVDLRSRFERMLYPMGQPAPDDEQFALSTLRHALGFNNYGGGTAYRNYYTSSPGCSDYDALMALCSGPLPLMSYTAPSEGQYTCFHVTVTGHDFVKRRLGLKSRA